jgi:hypothetical protein
MDLQSLFPPVQNSGFPHAKKHPLTMELQYATLNTVPPEAGWYG